jgi:ADP-ribose pyrophosphatase YjhB (NUDIX family)
MVIMREEGISKIEVHVAGICLMKKDNAYNVLIAKRSSKRNLYPSFWECGGGQVNIGENFEEAVKRQLREELGVIVEVLCPVGTYEIPVKTEQKKIPGMRFVCKVLGFVVKKPRFDKKEFTECRWIPIKDVDKYKFIPGIKESIKEVVHILGLSRMC